MLASSEPEGPAVISGTVNSAFYQNMLKKNIQLLGHDLELKRTYAAK